MTRSTRLFALLLLGTLSAGCAADITDDPEVTTPPAEEPPAPEVTVACDTGLPTADDSGTYVLGIVPIDAVDDVAMVKLAADVTVADDGSSFSVVMQGLDQASNEPCGQEQRFENIALRDDGTFYIPEMVLHVPQEAMGLDHGQTGWAAVMGGFCTETGSFQGSYEGWTFTPTAVEAAGTWFMAPPGVLVP